MSLDHYFTILIGHTSPPFEGLRPSAPGPVADRTAPRFWLGRRCRPRDVFDNPIDFAPVLDTLFKPNRNPKQARLKDVAGVLFDIQDEAVTRLLLTKTLVTDRSKIGVMISATW
jgi:hypothetical protein